MRRPVTSGALVGAALALTFLFAPSDVLGAEAGAAPGAAVSPTVVELYTSQGCSSCPPADAFLGELSRRDDIIALSFHVDYWDYIGWRDPFASAEATARQRAYSQKLHPRYVYTPQMVIDGAAQEMGSRRDKVLRIIERESRSKRLRVPITAAAADGRLTVTIPAAAYENMAAVWIIEFDDEHVTRVKRGENQGRTIRNVNVVREIRRIGTWMGEPLELTVDLAGFSAEERDGCVVVLQPDEVGPVLGAVKVPLD